MSGDFSQNILRIFAFNKTSAQNFVMLKDKKSTISKIFFYTNVNFPLGIIDF